MKRKIGSLVLLIIVLIGVISFIMFKESKAKLKLESMDVNSNKLISMMLEQDDGSYKEVSDNKWPQSGYEFNAEKSKCEQGSKITYNEETKQVQVLATKSDKCYVYFDKATLAKVCEGKSADCLAQNADLEPTLYHHDSSLEGGAQDDSYRYAGATNTVNNYVCLDGTSTTSGACANGDNDLYRIIGLFKNNNGQYEMKLIKYDYATSSQLGTTGAYKATYSFSTSDYKGNKDNLANIGSYYWASSNNYVNEWAGSALRETNLNEYYLNTYLKTTKKIDTENLIITHTWSLNGHNIESVPPKEMYDNEMNKVASNPSKPTQTKTKDDKIGLMYGSDYGYAADPSSVSNWNTNLNNTSYGTSNWMYMGLDEWTVSRYSSDSHNVFSVSSYGHVNTYYSVYGNAYGVRPSFYLTSSVKITGGDGSKTNPYRVAV